MSEGLRLVLYGLGHLAVLTALGSGPARWLSRRLERAWVLAPVLGLALASALLTSVAAVTSMRVGAWAVLLPACLLSLGWCLAPLARERRAPRRPQPEAAVPAALGTVGLILAVLPGITRGTVGPLSLMFYDAWGYINTETWLTDQAVRDAPPAGNPSPDLILTFGWAITQGGIRMGVSVLNAADAVLMGTTPDTTQMALVGALCALVPLVVWMMARALGASPAWAAVAGALGLSPAVLLLVSDTYTANLAALSLIPAALTLAAVGARRDDRRILLGAGILAGGVVATFPEFLLPALLSAGACALLVLWRAPGGLWTGVVALVRQSAWIAVAAAVVAPVGIVRAAEYLALRGGDTSFADFLPERWLSPETVGAWAFGVVHLYELSRFELLDGARTAVAVGLPLVLGVLLVCGLARAGTRRAAFVVVPIVVSAALGLAVRHQYQAGACEYCLWKSLTFMLPFLAAGLGLALTRLAPAGRGRLALAARAALAGVALVLVAMVVRADIELTRAQHESAGIVRSQLRTVGDAAAELPSGTTVLLEGADASPPQVEYFTVPAYYYFVRGGGRRVVFDTSTPGDQYLLSPAPPELYYSPDYDYVLTAFPGISGRRTVAAAGPYALQRRAPVDAALVRTGYAQDPAEGPGAVAWVGQPFQIWVASPEPGRVALRVRLSRPAGPDATLQLTDPGGRELTVARLEGGDLLCADLSVQSGRTVVDAAPVLPAPTAPPTRATESDPQPPPPRALAVVGLTASPGRCPPDRNAPRAVSAGPGFFAPEIGSDGGTFRWMGSEATLSLGTPGFARPRLRLRMLGSALRAPQRLTASLDGRDLVVTTLRAGQWREVAIVVPAGRGRADLRLRAEPGAEPAALVNPADPRRLAVVLTDPQVDSP